MEPCADGQGLRNPPSHRRVAASCAPVTLLCAGTRGTSMSVLSENVDECETTLATGSVRGSSADPDFFGIRVSALADLIMGRGSSMGMRRGDAGELL